MNRLMSRMNFRLLPKTAVDDTSDSDPKETPPPPEETPTNIENPSD